MVDYCQKSSNSSHLIGAMDRLWFQQIILFPSSELLLMAHPPPPPPRLLASRTHDPQPQDDQTTTSNSTSSCFLSSEFTMSSANNSSSSTLSSEDVVGTDEEEEEETFSPLSSPNTCPLPSQLQDDDNDNIDEKEAMFKSRKRPARLALIESRSRSRSSSPSLNKIPLRHRANTGTIMSPLRKTSSCRSLCEELEFEELKGFIDLGFRFKKEKLCPRMMTVIPGLQRFGSNESNGSDEYEEVSHDDEGNKKMRRPYLSEAWLIKSPNSPLLNLRMPPATNSTVMKKHLKSWARTVATVVQVEY